VHSIISPLFVLLWNYCESHHLRAPQDGELRFLSDFFFGQEFVQVINAINRLAVVSNYYISFKQASLLRGLDLISIFILMISWFRVIWTIYSFVQANSKKKYQFPSPDRANAV
jgi:hypothetical protein